MLILLKPTSPLNGARMTVSSRRARAEFTCASATWSCAWISSSSTSDTTWLAASVSRRPKRLRRSLRLASARSRSARISRLSSSTSTSPSFTLWPSSKWMAATTLEMRGVTSMASLARAVASAVYLSVMSPSSTASVTTGGGPPPNRAMLLAVSSPPQPASSSSASAAAAAVIDRLAVVGRK